MKKLLFLALALCSAIVFSSCSSIPKKVKPGDTLAAGRITTSLYGYKNFEDVNPNSGKIPTDIELTIYDTKYCKTVKTVNCDKDGFFFITGLKPHESYAISQVKVTKHGSSGASVTVGVTIPNEKMFGFVSYDNKIVNIGTTHFNFDGYKNYVNWEVSDYFRIRTNLNKHKDDWDSEWLDKEIVDWK